MSKLGIMTTIIATSLCDAVVKDEQGEGLDISAGLYGDETTKFIKDIAQQIIDADASPSELQVKYDRLLVLLGERDELVDDIYNYGKSNPASDLHVSRN